MTCRLCGHPLKLIMDLGEQPPSNALLTRPGAFEQRYPLELARCAMCTLVQLVHTVPPKRIFNEGYPLHSSKGSRAWLDHAEGLCGYTWGRFALSSQSMVIEIGSNDGYLLRNYLGACQVTAWIRPAYPQTCRRYRRSSMRLWRSHAAQGRRRVRTQYCRADPRPQ